MKNKQKNTWLKAMGVALSCALLATAAPVGVLAEEVPSTESTEATTVEEVQTTEATCGDNATYKLDSNGLLTISGEGAISEEAFMDNTSIASVVIEDGITGIGYAAFSGCSNLTNIDIANSVTVISSNAFSGCSKLTDIVIPDGVTEIWNEAFSGCSSLVSVKLPNSLEYWGNDVFAYCTSLPSIVIPDGIDRVNHRDFGNCTSLTSVFIPESVTDIRSEAFLNCDNLTDIYYAGTEAQWNEVEKGYYSGDDYFGCGIPDTATIHFESTGLDDSANDTEEGTCGDNATYTLDSNGLLTISGEGAIHTGAFLDNTNIKNVVIEEGITSIGNNAFGRCSNLTSISIPKGVTTIENAAFNGCESLTSITLPEGITSINWRVFEGCTSLTSISIPEGVTDIAWQAFILCSNLTSIELPVSLTSIGEDAFSGALTDIYYAGTEAQWNEIEIDMYAIPDTATIHFESVNKDDTTTKNEPYTVELTSDNTIIKTADFAAILEENKTKDVVIKSNNGVSFTFAKGTMSAVDGMENYDFGTTLVSDFANAGKMDSSVTKDNFVARINYDYSGKLPAKASIRIYVGTDYANQTLYYSQILENGFKFIQSVVVDAEGYVTVTQDHCSDYVLAAEKLDTTVPTETPDNTEDGTTETPDNTEDVTTETPDNSEDGTTETPDNTEEDTASPKTGDSSSIMLYAMMVVFGTGIVAVGMRRKFHN